MRPGTTQVRVAGAKVGTVEKVERQEDGDGALVTFRITDPTITVKQDARATVYGRTLLGFFFEMDLEPGSENSPELADGEAIAETRPTTPPTSTRRSSRSTSTGARASEDLHRRERGRVRRARRAPDDRRRRARRASRSAPASTRSRASARATSGGWLTATGQRHARTRPQRDGARRLLVNGGDHLQAVASQSGALASAVADGPETMDSIQVTMRRCATRSTSSIRWHASCGPAPASSTRPLGGQQHLRRAGSAARARRQDLRRARPGGPPAGRGGQDGGPLIDRLEPTVDRSNESILPHLEAYDTDTKLKNYEAIGPFFSAVGSLGAHFSEGGAHSANFTVGVGEAIVGGGSPCQTALVDPTAEEKVNCDAFVAVLNQALGIAPSGTTAAKSAGGSIGGDKK